MIQKSNYHKISQVLKGCDFTMLSDHSIVKRPHKGGGNIWLLYYNLVSGDCQFWIKFGVFSQSQLRLKNRTLDKKHFLL